MLKGLPLATKLAGGFGSLVAVLAILGGMAIWSMRSGQSTAELLSGAYVPEVALSNNIERAAHELLFQMRGYAFTHADTFLRAARGHLADVHKHLGDAERLIAATPALAANLESCRATQQRAVEYERLIDETVAAGADLAAAQGALRTTAAEYLEHCAAYLAAQQVSAPTDADGAAAADADRGAWIATVHEVIDHGNAAQVAAWQAVAARELAGLDDARSALDLVEPRLRVLDERTHDTAHRDQLAQIRAAVGGFRTALDALGREWARLDELDRVRGAAAVAIIDQAKTLAESGMEATGRMADETEVVLARSVNVMIGGVALAVLLSVGLAVSVTRSIARPLRNTFRGLRGCSTAELEQTAATFGRIIDAMTDGVTQVNEAAAQVATASQQLAGGASEQASALEETSSALEEMAAMARTNATNSRAANEIATQAHEAAGQGEQTMLGINDASDRISRIIKVIEEIAFQTNLLALNAAVEAARAGEHGKGFAVVAEEVRNLAQRAAGAARETTGLIEEAVNKSRAGKAAMQEIVGGVARVTELINGIARASEEQAQGVDQVNSAVAQMDKVTQQNAASAEESASASEELSAQAQTTRSLVQELIRLVRGAESGATASTTTAPPSAAPRTARRAPPAAAPKGTPTPVAALPAGDDRTDF